MRRRYKGNKWPSRRCLELDRSSKAGDPPQPDYRRSLKRTSWCDDRQASKKKQRRPRFASRPTPRNISGEAPMMAERLHSRALVPHERWRPDRRLRNRIIVGNAIAWIAIVILIRLL